MSLWHLLTLLAGVSAFVGSIAASLTAGRDSHALLLTASVGLALGVLAALVPVAVRRRVLEAGAVADDAAGDRWLKLLYVAAVAWIVLAYCLAYAATRTLSAVFAS